MQNMTKSYKLETSLKVRLAIHSTGQILNRSKVLNLDNLFVWNCAIQKRIQQLCHANFGPVFCKAADTCCNFSRAGDAILDYCCSKVLPYLSWYILKLCLVLAKGQKIEIALAVRGNCSMYWKLKWNLQIIRILLWNSRRKYLKKNTFNPTMSAWEPLCTSET